MAAMAIARVLSIGGSDSGGGAGIQADVKTLTVFGVYAMTAITAVTAQDTEAVRVIHRVPAEVVGAQIDAVVRDIGVDAAKTGMLVDAEIIRAVASAVRSHRITQLVVDPVMVSGSGTLLLDPTARAVLLQEIVPLARLITPNLDEAGVLTERPVRSPEEMRLAARSLITRGARAVLVKGGHLTGGDAVDVYDDGRVQHELHAPRIDVPTCHGTGCQLSAAIAAGLAQGLPMLEAIDRAKRFISAAIAGRLTLGHGDAPANPLAWHPQ